MTIAKTMNARLDKLQPNERRRLCIVAEPGETEMELYGRAAALGYPVAIVPRVCATSEEWERTYAPSGKREA